MSQSTVLVVNPSADVYGADLQMLESASALRAGGRRVVVATPGPGPLVTMLRDRGVEVVHTRYPVLRRADLSAHGTAALGTSLPAAMTRMRRLVEKIGPSVVYVNTITLPWWLAVARRCRVPVVCHAHEAEAADRALVRKALSAPLLLADLVVVNSRTTGQVLCGAAPRLTSRCRLVYNGVRGPTSPPAPREPEAPYRLLVVGRLSARKAPHVAVAALALLRRGGRDVELELCGTPAPGQESYVATLMARTHEPDLRGKVRFIGYRSPVWPALARCDALVAPSLGESFGNAVVEGQLARRPVVATAVQGHLETVRHGVTGLLVPPEDPGAIAASVCRLMDDRNMARQVAFLGMRHAEARFGVARYAAEINDVVDELTGVSHLEVSGAGRKLVERKA